MSNKSKIGFTLVEIMVASSVLVFSLVSFLALFNNLLKGANYNEGISLASAACRSKLEEISAHDFDNITIDYVPGGTPGNIFTFNPAGTIGITGKGTIVITPFSSYGASNGAHWVQVAASAWPVRTGHASLVHDGKMWVLGGYNETGVCKNDVWSSADGTTWNQTVAHANWSPRVSPGAIEYSGKMWVMGGIVDSGGIKNDVWSSLNGVQWDLATAAAYWDPRFDFSNVVYADQMWVIGGHLGSVLEHDVFNSTTGSAWQMPTWDASFSRRFDHTADVFNNKMWVLGGNDGSPRNDVWYSTSADGKNWARATANAGWAARDTHATLVYNDKIWVMGGSASTGDKNDVWYSGDGTTWSCATAAAEWGPRNGLNSLVFNNKMWILGGSGGGMKGDVWYSTGSERLLEVLITVCWRHLDGRVFGEDANLNGILDSGEDRSPLNGKIDSPVQLRLLLSNKKLPLLRRTFLGRP